MSLQFPPLQNSLTGFQPPGFGTPNTQLPPNFAPLVFEPPIRDQCSEIVKDLAQKIVAARSLGYGWESWLQVEIGVALAVRAQSYGGNTVRREKAVYVNPAMKVDLWIPGDETRPNVGIELKVKTRTQDFPTAMIEDYDNRAEVSVDSGIGQGAKRLTGTRLYGIGFTTDTDDVKKVLQALPMRAADAVTAGVLIYGEQTIYRMPDGQGLYMVWWCRKY